MYKHRSFSYPEEGVLKLHFPAGGVTKPCLGDCDLGVPSLAQVFLVQWSAGARHCS